jgi:transcriptional regulator with XRE-family HTH domain
MKNRIKKLIDNQKMSSVQFASEIGIAPSSLHHIVSGRNNPSLEVIQKILDRFSHLNAEWLVNGQGSPYKDMVQGELFDIPIQTTNKLEDAEGLVNTRADDIANSVTKTEKTTSKSIEKIVIFYTDKTFEVYNG